MKLVEDSQVIEIVQGVFTMTLGMDCQASEPSEGQETIDVSVSISGAWDGNVVVRIPYALARSTAATMFMVDGSEASDADLLDAVGEIANQVAGSVKAILPAPSDLALPTRVRESNDDGVETFWFRAEDEAFSILFYPSKGDQAGAA